jgi:hypothetical protein
MEGFDIVAIVEHFLSRTKGARFARAGRRSYATPLLTNFTYQYS